MPQSARMLTDVENRLSFETLISDLSARMVAAADETTGVAIESALRQVSEFFGADRSGMISVRPGQHWAHVLYAWYAEEFSSPIPRDFNLADAFPWAYHVLVERRVPHIVDRTDDQPPEAERDRANHRAMGVRSTLNIPIVVNAEREYIITVESLRQEVHWPPSYVPRLHLLGAIFANTIERNRVADALRESEARLALATRSAGAGAWDLDVASGRIWATPEAKALYGFPDDADVTFDTFLGCVHPDDIDRVRDRVARVVASDSDFVDEYRIVLPGGEIRWIAAHGRVRTEPGARSAHLMGVSLDATARKLAEDERLQSVAHLQAAVDVAGLGFYLMTDRGETVTLDERVREILGIPPEEEQRTRLFWLEHVHPDDRDRMLDLSRQVTAGHVDHVSADYRYLHPARGLIWVSHSVRAVNRERGGLATGIAGVLQDITERKSGEDAIRRSEARLASAIDAASLGFYEVRDGAEVTYVDSRSRDLFGVPEDQAHGAPALEFWVGHLHPDDCQRLMEIREQLYDGRLDRTSVEYRYLHPDRGVIWLQHLMHVVIRHATGRAAKTIGVVRDISEDKWRQEALRTSEEVNRATFEQAAVGIAHVGTDGRWLRVNDKLCDILCYTRDELLGRTLLEATDPEDLAASQDAVRQILAARTKSFSLDKRYIRRDGSRIWVTLTASLVLDGAGVPKYLVAVVQDITSRKLTEQTLAKAHADVQRLREQLERENLYLREEASVLKSRASIVGRSPAIRHAIMEIEKVAGTDSTVLLLGETGTGKELFAAAIHELSPRRDRLMVRVNCAAIPLTLIESELFGRERGAYTGALAKQIGRFEMASGSTIFLDEIGDLPPDIQMKLLRVLQERQIERLGSPRPVAVDLRIITATNRDLEHDVREGRFREDLYYRLNVFPVRVPPLRERVEDLPLLVESLIGELTGRMGKRVESVSQASMDRLRRYSWPGNVRELRNVIERAMILATGPVLEIEVPRIGPVAEPAPPQPGAGSLDREELLNILQQTGWRIRGKNGAAERLGLKPTTLEARIARLGIKRP